MVKNLSAMQDTRVQSLGQEDPLEKGMATPSSILAWRTSWSEGILVRHSPWGHKELDVTEQLILQQQQPTYIGSYLIILDTQPISPQILNGSGILQVSTFLQLTS